MDTRLSITHAIWRLVAAVMALVVVTTLGATSVSAASPTACRVQNTMTGKTYTALQQAVDAARQRDRLTVKGVCVGKTVIDKDLVITGERTERTVKPVLSGAGKVRVLEIKQGARVSLRDLVITRGLAVRGAGIRNRGRLTLRDVVVRGNSNYPDTWRGRGPGVYNEGRLRLNGATRIAHNDPTNGSLYEVFNRGTLVVNGSSFIQDLTNQRHAALTMNGGSFLGGDRGGALFNDGRVTMNDASWVRPRPYATDDSSYVYGVYNYGTFTMNDTTSIRDGRDQAAGVRNYGTYYDEPATFTMNDASSISGNPMGGLINDGIVRMSDDSSIHDNSNYCEGGGVLMWGGRLRMTGSSSITANAVIDHGTDDAWQCDYGVRGGGIYRSKGTLVGVTCGPGGNVYGNSPDDCYIEP
jgi:hypothetical protein